MMPLLMDPWKKLCSHSATQESPTVGSLMKMALPLFLSGSLVSTLSRLKLLTMYRNSKPWKSTAMLAQKPVLFNMRSLCFPNQQMTVSRFPLAGVRPPLRLLLTEPLLLSHLNRILTCMFFKWIPLIPEFSVRHTLVTPVAAATLTLITIFLMVESERKLSQSVTQLHSLDS